jgi:ribosomal protein L40E
MTCPSLGLRAPAERYGSNWRTSYLHRALRATRKALLHITQVIFGCNHRNLSEVTGEQQTCLDCHAWRYVLAPTVHLEAYTSRWHSMESRPRVNAPAAPAAIACPPALRRLLDEDARDAAFIKLLFAAKRMADRKMRYGVAETETEGALVCIECGARVRSGRLEHDRTCDTGAVLAAIAELESLVSKSHEKEAAEGEETNGAGDGIRPRGFDELICLKCGQRGGDRWTSRFVREAIDLPPLGLNQVAKRAGLGLHVLYTHACAAATAVDELPAVRCHEGGAR